MTASEEAKEFGFRTLVEVAELSGFNTRKLATIHKSNPQGFQTILWGAWVRKGSA